MPEAAKCERRTRCQNDSESLALPSGTHSLSWGRAGKSGRYFPSWTDGDCDEQFMTDKERGSLMLEEQAFLTLVILAGANPSAHDA